MHRRGFLATLPLATAATAASGRGVSSRSLPDGRDAPDQPERWIDVEAALVIPLAAIPSRHIRIVGDGATNVLSFGTAPQGLTKVLRCAAAFALYCGFRDPDGLAGPPGVKIIGNMPAASRTPDGLGGRLLVQSGDVLVVTCVGDQVWEVLEFQAHSTEAYLLNPEADDSHGHPAPYMKTWGKVGRGRFPTLAFGIDPNSGKAYAGGMMLRDWGDTPEISFDIGDQTKSGDPIPIGGGGLTAPWPGGYIYSRAGIPDGAGGLRFVDQDAYGRMGGDPIDFFNGRCAQLEFPVTENPTQHGTGGGFTVCVTRNGTVTPIQRSWWSNTGNFIAAGKATFEAAKLSYPYDVTRLGLAPHRQMWTAPSKDCNYFDTPGWGNISVICTDIADPELDYNAAISMRRYGDHGRGVDFGYDFAADRWAAYRVLDGKRRQALSIAPGSGDITLGQEASDRHVISGVIATPHNPAFHAVLASDIVEATGDGRTHTIYFDEEVFDRSGHYDPSRGRFTAPISGIYQLQTHVQLGSFGKRNGLAIEIATSGRLYRLQPGLPAADANDCAGAGLSVLAAMKAGDVADVRIIVEGGPRTVRILSGGAVSRTSFSGFLVG